MSVKNQLPKIALRKIRNCAIQFGVKIVPPHEGAGRHIFTVGERPATIRTLYHGGAHVAQHIEDGANLALVQLGAQGDFLAILPARDLFRLMADAQSKSKSEFTDARPAENRPESVPGEPLQ